MDITVSSSEQDFTVLAELVAGKLTENSNKLMKQVLSIVFDQEAFVPLVNKSTTHKTHNQKLPFVELLARHENGQSAGHLFDEARKYDCVVEADLIAIEKAIQKQMALGCPVSLNLNVETFSSKALISKLDEMAEKYPTFDPRDICLEITEQGGVPENFDLGVLSALKNRGYALALDDFDPRQEKEQLRLEKFAAYVDIVKFPYEVLQIVRSGSLKDVETLGETIKNIKDDHPHITFVMEGVRSSDDDLLPILKELGVDLFQATKYKSDVEVTTSRALPFQPLPIALAL